MSEQMKQEETYRIKVITPVGTWVSVPAALKEIDPFVVAYNIASANHLFIKTDSGTVYFNNEIAKQSVLEVLEEAQDKPKGWIENTGKQPVDDNILVDVRIGDGSIYEDTPADEWGWSRCGGTYEITHWRYSK